MIEINKNGSVNVQRSRWLTDVIRAFQAAGGSARFPQIERWVRANRKLLPISWKEAIRATVYDHSSDSPVYEQGNPDIFYKIEKGLWALRHPSDTVLGKSDNDFFQQILMSMSRDELVGYSGRGNDLIAYIKQQVEKKKRTFRIQ